MQLDVAQLRDFYTTPLGQAARRLLSVRIRARIHPANGLTVAGLGYCPPFLGAYRGEAAHVIALMPEVQGALVWPADGPKLSSLVDESRLPLPDNSVDRLLVTHCLELSEHVRPLLRELWRVLKPEGRLLLVVPNRRGLWAHVDTTPFGYGRPFSRSQLEAVLRDSMFTPIDWSSALHVPPLNQGILLRSATAWERVGSRLWPALGGVLVVEAAKETVAVRGKLARARTIRDLVTAPAKT